MWCATVGGGQLPGHAKKLTGHACAHLCTMSRALASSAHADNAPSSVAQVFQQLLGWRLDEANAYLRRRPRLATVPRETVTARMHSLLAVDNPPVPLRVTQLLRKTSMMLQDPHAQNNFAQRFDSSRTVLGYSPQAMWRAVLRHPKLIHVRAEAMAQRLAFLKEEYGTEGAARLVRHQPALLTRKIETLRQVITTLAAELQLAPDEARRLFVANPQLACQAGNVEIFRARLERLGEVVGCTVQEARTLARRKPQVLRRSPAAIEALMQTLNQAFGPELAHIVVVRRAPALLELTSAGFEQRVAVLVRVLAIDRVDVLQTVSSMPTLLLLSESNLQAKVDFLAGECGLSQASVAQAYHLLSLSLSRRLLPRKRLIDQHHPGLRFSPYLFSLSDEKFAGRLGEAAVTGQGKQPDGSNENMDTPTAATSHTSSRHLHQVPML